MLTLVTNDNKRIMEIIEIIKVIAFGFFLTGVPNLFKNLMTIRKRKRIIDWLDLMACIKCNVFWITLITTQDIWWASVASMVAYLVDKFIINASTNL